jgi:putative transposase
MISHSSLDVRSTCATLKVSRSSFYGWKNKKFTIDKDGDVLTEIRTIAAEFSRYGYRRVTKELQRRDLIVNHKRVHRLMRKHSLLVKRKRFTPKTTQSNHNLPRYENLAKKAVITAPNMVWVSDITYIHLRDGFVYLALIMDLFSRKIVGWDLSRNVDTDLTLTALNKAIMFRGIKEVKGCIHHSDHGVQYLSAVYVDRLRDLEMLPSMGEVGNSYDNAHAESLNKTIKNEEVWINEYETFEQAYWGIQQFVQIYNEKRLHSSIGYVPPNEFEQQQINIRLVS